MNITPYMNCMALISHIIILKWLSNTQLYILYNHIIMLYHVLYQLRIIFPRILWYFNVFQLILPGHPSNTTRILWHQGMGERTRERLLPLSTRRTVDIWWISVDKGIRMDQNGSVRWPGEIRLKSEDICISFAWVWQVVWMVSSPTSWKQLCTTIDKLKMHGSSCWKWDGGTRTDGSTSKNALESWVPPTIGQSSLKVPGKSLRRETTWALLLPNRNYQCCVM